MDNQTVFESLKVIFKEHDYNKSYEELSIVTKTTGDVVNLYQASKAVPRLVAITDKRYWQQLDKFNSQGGSSSNTPDYLCFKANKAGATLRLAGVGMGESQFAPEPLNIEYSTDKKIWTPLTFLSNNGLSISDNITFSSAGDKVYFRGDNLKGTADFNIEENKMWFYVFVGNSGTLATDNEFAVSGDLQTIVDKSGNDKEHGIFGAYGGLFSNVEEASDISDDLTPILITSAPKLTATKLISNKYRALFAGQYLLEEPAGMPRFTTEDLPGDLHDESFIQVIDANCFSSMYFGCSALKHPANLNALTASSEYDFMLIAYNCLSMYLNTTFNITNDYGVTLNGFSGLNFPMVMSELEDVEVNSAMFAGEILGTLEGFYKHFIYVDYNNLVTPIPFNGLDSMSYSDIVLASYLPEDKFDATFRVGVVDGRDKFGILSDAINTTEYVLTTTTQLEYTNYRFVKWQESANGETWTDVPASSYIQNQPGAIYIPIFARDYYYRMVLEARD